MEEVVSAARRIEKILQEQTTSGTNTLVESMNRQLQILTKDLAKAHEKLAVQTTAAPVTAALAAPTSQKVAAAQPPPASLEPPQMALPAASPLSPMATAQAPQFMQNTPPYFYENEEYPYSRGPGDRTGGPCDASSVMRKGISLTAVLPALCYSVCGDNRLKSRPGGRHGGKYWSSLRPMTALVHPPYI